MNAPANLIALDCRGMQCPAPILQIARTARQNRSEPVVLEVQADDQDFPIDVRAWCRTAKATLLQEETDSGVFRVWLGLNGAEVIPAGFGSPTDEPAPSPSSPILTRAPVAAPPRQEPVPAPLPIAAPVPSALSSTPTEPGHLDLRGQPVAGALLTISSRLLTSTDGLRVLIDPPHIGSVYTWASATQSTVTQQASDGPHLVLHITADSSVEITTPAPPTLPAAVPQPMPQATPQLPAVQSQENRCTLLVIHNDFEALMAALMVANGAAAQMMDVEIYFSFWGINLLRADQPGQGEEKPPFLKRMMAWMMPAGPSRQVLGKMNFGGMGTGMMTHFMRKSNILSLKELLDAAEEQGVKFVGCTMSMGLMGVRQCDLVDRSNLSFGGVTAFVEASQRSKMSMVF